MLLLLVVSTLDGATRGDGYDAARHWVSLLAHGERAWLGTVVLFASGALVLAASVAFHRAERRIGLPGGAWRSMAVLGGSLLVAGVFPMDATTSYPMVRAAPPAVSLSARIHGVAGVSIIAALALLLRATGRWYASSHSASDRTQTGLARAATKLGSTAIWLSSGACVTLAAVRGSGSWEAAWAGAFQRFALVVGAIGLTLSCIWLTRACDRAHETASSRGSS